MRLLVHAGTEKTGSSYLQTAFWAADEALVSERIHYSADRFDSSDRFGGVQGDGAAVGGLIHGRDEVGLIYLLRGWRRRAEERGCTAVLLSHAGLWRRLLRDGEAALCGPAAVAGLDEVSAFMLIRDPIDHAVSHYRQVVKAGWTVDRFDRWLKSDYQYLEGLAEVLSASSEISWVLRKYEPRRRSLDEVVLTDWLGVSPTVTRALAGEIAVNTSLTATEAVVLASLGSQISGMHDALAPRFLALPSSDRPTDDEAADWMYDHAVRHCQSQLQAAEVLNRYLPVDERLEIPQRLSPDLGSPPRDLHLSEAQWGAIVDGVGERLGDGPGRWRRYSRFTELQKAIFERTPDPVLRLYRLVRHPVRHCRSGRWIRRRGETQ